MHRIHIECPELASFCHNMKSERMASMTEKSPQAPKRL